MHNLSAHNIKGNTRKRFHNILSTTLKNKFVSDLSANEVFENSSVTICNNIRGFVTDNKRLYEYIITYEKQDIA